MSIGLIQAFHYETDDKSPFLTVVDTICRVTFPVIENQFVRLHISTSGNGFNNGKRWIGPKELSASNPKGWSPPKRFFICSVKDYSSDIKHIEQFLQDDPNFKKSLDLRFNEECGHGYTDWFTTSDGDVDIGYCISYRPNGGWNNFDISLTHIYYGK